MFLCASASEGVGEEAFGSATGQDLLFDISFFHRLSGRTSRKAMKQATTPIDVERSRAPPNIRRFTGPNAFRGGSATNYPRPLSLTSRPKGPLVRAYAGETVDVQRHGAPQHYEP